MIEIKGLSKRFGKKLVLDNLNFKVEKGEYIVILGPTGAGKTTLLRIIAGLERPTSGEVWRDGRRIDKLEPEERKIAYLSQTYALFPHMNILENVMFPRIVSGTNPAIAMKVAEEYLTLMNLLSRKTSFPREMSGGMMQRVALARALASGFEILLFDEPLRALDAKLRIMLRSELKKIAKDFGITVIHVTHDEEEAMEIGDRIIVLRRGKIVQEGKPEKIFSEPATPFVANFVGGGNFMAFFVEACSSNELILKDVHGRKLKVVVNKKFKVGEKVLVCMRYEQMELVMTEEENSFYGCVDKIYQVGKFYEIDFSTEYERLLAKMPITERLPANEGVHCWLKPKKVLCFSAENLNIQEELEVE
ncbi:MAG: ABC transporter ATP-binding protein [Thermoplasmata archaeon]